MPTAAQRAANRENSRKSTGPRTPEGKARSSANSRKLGVTGRRLVVEPGEKNEFENLRDALYEEIKPEGALEHEAFLHLVQAAWNQRRCQNVLDIHLDKLVKKGNAPSLDYYEVKHDHRLMEIYARRAGSAYDKALKQLRDLQSQRCLRACLDAPDPVLHAAAAPRLADLPWLQNAILKNRSQSARLPRPQPAPNPPHSDLIVDLPEAA